MFIYNIDKDAFVYTWHRQSLPIFYGLKIIFVYIAQEKLSISGIDNIYSPYRQYMDNIN